MPRKLRKASVEVGSLPLMQPDAEPVLLFGISKESKAQVTVQEKIVSFADYKTQWLETIRANEPSNTDLGHRFGSKLITQWLDVESNSDNLIYCDGKGDGGIDVAYLSMGSSRSSDSDSPTEGDTWYLLQSKYGTAFRGSNTLLAEGIKVIDTITGQRKDLSSLAKGLLERLSIFREKASDLDRITLVFGTEEPLSEKEQEMLNKVRVIGHDQLGPLFDVDAVSIKTIYQRIQSESKATPYQVSVPIKVTLDSSSLDLRVGTVSLIALYDFLDAYKKLTGDLNLLYEKNVRRSLGVGTKVNSKIRNTLNGTPDQFGLYNNGITIVVTNYQENKDGTLQLIEPYVVNGCQTTQMIWNVCSSKLKSGGTGSSAQHTQWYESASKGVVVTKIVKVGVGVEAGELLRNIARFTNSQNAIKDQDFLALEEDFNTWATQMADDYNVFMETQRGEWDSQQAFQQQNPQSRRFKDHANAFDLIKVYGAGWLGLPGIAFSDNAPFIPPNGSVYKQIIDEHREHDEEFGAEDLYAAYHLKVSADTYGYGGKSQATKSSRGQTRYMFYMVVLDLLSDVLAWGNIKNTPKGLTRALVKLFAKGNESVITILLDLAVQLIDEYFSDGREESVYTEPAFLDQFHKDLGAYLKWNKLGRADMAKHAPKLQGLILGYRRAMGINMGGQKPARDLILQAIKQ